ncbi:MAG TPA: hypothetical protein PK449_08605, partial [Exilispira sp.]|nr:hypothetical protein [Exilispira sp.]
IRRALLIKNHGKKSTCKKRRYIKQIEQKENDNFSNQCFSEETIIHNYSKLTLTIQYKYL